MKVLAEAVARTNLADLGIGVLQRVQALPLAGGIKADQSVHRVGGTQVSSAERSECFWLFGIVVGRFLGIRHTGLSPSIVEHSAYWSEPL